MTWKHRYTVLSVLFCAYMVCYLDRMVMASAIPFIADDFHLSSMTMGKLLSAFFVGYALMQIPGGLLADRFGPRAVLTCSITWFSIMTALTGLAPGLTVMLTIRVLFGLGEGPFPGGVSKALSRWFPKAEVARANGLQMGATGLGATIAPLFVIALISNWGWRAVFYTLFLPGFLMAWLVWRYVRNSPPESRHVTPTEMREYDRVLAQPVSIRATFLQALRTPAIRWCALSLFLSNTVLWGLMNWLPTYLLRARGFDTTRMGVFAALTNLAGVLGSVLGGHLCDKYFSQKLRVPIMVGLLFSAGFTYLAAIVPTREWAVVCLVFVFLIANAAATATFTVPIVVVPKQSVGSAMGVVNTAGQLAGVLAPILVGYILKITHDSFEIVLYSMVVFAFVAVWPASQIRQPIIAATPAEGLI